MPRTAQLTLSKIQELRDKHYNATVSEFSRLNDDLAILRVRPDQSSLSFTAGQYAVLGLGYWEPRVSGTQPETLDKEDQSHIARRAYSISCAIVDGCGQPLRATANDDAEFYVALVRRGQHHAPALTPRLFALDAGDRIFLSQKCHGHYTLERVQPSDYIVFLATGTGEAPHNAMLAELLARGHRCPIAAVVCNRYRRDFGYLKTYRLIERTHPNCTYLPLTTREPENLDSSSVNYVGKQYLQDCFSSGQMEHDCGFPFDPDHTQVFLCGNPDMIGVPRHTHDPVRRYPKPTGMVEVLERRGFRVDQPHEPGNIHYEKYW